MKNKNKKKEKKKRKGDIVGIRILGNDRITKSVIMSLNDLVFLKRLGKGIGRILERLGAFSFLRSHYLRSLSYEIGRVVPYHFQQRNGG